jgi:hypothetical protein
MDRVRSNIPVDYKKLTKPEWTTKVPRVSCIPLMISMLYCYPKPTFSVSHRWVRCHRPPVSYLSGSSALFWSFPYPSFLPLQVDGWLCLIQELKWTSWISRDSVIRPMWPWNSFGCWSWMTPRSGRGLEREHPDRNVYCIRIADWTDIGP